MDNKTMQKVINGMSDKIELLHEAVKISNEMQKISKEKIDNLDVWKIKLNDMDKILLNRIECLEDKIDDIMSWVNLDLNETLDDLTAKNYQLKSELDGIYKVLEMDADDIKALQNKVFNGYTREQKRSK